MTFRNLEFKWLLRISSALIILGLLVEIASLFGFIRSRLCSSPSWGHR